MEKKQQMNRRLKSRHIELMALGGTIGTGLFLGSGKAIREAGPAILLAYLITGIICFGIMRALGELLLSNLHYRSFMEAIRDYLGPRVSFVAGWAYWACWLALAMAEITAVGLYIQIWLPHVPQWIPGLITLVIFLCLNLITVNVFGEIEFWFALIKILAIVILVVVGILMMILQFKTTDGYVASPMNLVRYHGFFATGLGGFARSFQMVVFAFVGIEMVGVTAAEAENPRKVIPRAINGIPIRILGSDHVHLPVGPPVAEQQSLCPGLPGCRAARGGQHRQLRGDHGGGLSLQQFNLHDGTDAGGADEQCPPASHSAD